MKHTPGPKCTERGRFTPGPWVVATPSDSTEYLSIEQDALEVEGGESIVAEVDLMGDGIDTETGTANARLIAAAPDLLAALEECITDDNAACWRSVDHMIRRLHAISDTARAAIAKATGEG